MSDTVSSSCDMPVLLEVEVYWTGPQDTDDKLLLNNRKNLNHLAFVGIPVFRKPL